MTGLELNFDETFFRFSIDGKGSGDWVIVSVTVKNRFFDYQNIRDESLEFHDLIKICNHFNMLLNDEIEEPWEFSFTEPFYEFRMLPKRYFQFFDDAEAMAEFTINLDNIKNYFNGQKYVLLFGEDEIIAWRDYLNKMIVEFGVGSDSIKP